MARTARSEIFNPLEIAIAHVIQLIFRTSRRKYLGNLLLDVFALRRDSVWVVDMMPSELCDFFQIFGSTCRRV